jgi:dipeptidyl aminopeptidase/acylaminoacyl peptidase
MRNLVLVVASLLPCLAARAADPHPFNVRDMQALDRVGDLTVSADGKLVAFAVTSTDLDANKRYGSLWLVRSDGTGLRRLTAAERVRDTGPRFTPDGKWVWFLSNRSGSNQAWRIPVDGGEAERMTDEPLEVQNLLVSPDGARIAYTMAVFPDCDSPACTRKRLDDTAARKATGRLYDSLMIRHWDTWSDGTRSHLFVRGSARGARAVDVTVGMNADVPPTPFGGIEELAFTPESRSIVFTAKDVGRKEAWSTNLDLYVVPCDGSAKPKNLTADNPATDTHPTFSPDGKALAYLAMARAGYEADRLRVMAMPWPPSGAKPRALAHAWDRSPDDLSWARDGRSLLATADSMGHKGAFRIDAASGKVTELVAAGTARSPRDAAGVVVYGHESFRAPTDVWTMRPDGSAAKKITAFNAERLAAARMGDIEELWFPGANGDNVHAWIIKPVGFDAAKRYPVAFLIHGGPQGSWDDDFHYRWNPELFAAAGYATVAVDFHGSTGYGQAFVDAINDDWGGKPLVDLEKGLAAALAKYKWMDGDRACALGASYGGWMINWIAGNWPDPWKCLVSHDGNLDERASYYNTEELWFPEWEHKGTPWDNPAGYTKADPAEHVAKWKTPMLVVHGGQDFRVVDTQGISTFTALQRRGIPSKLLYFPDENHWVQKPQNSILWYDTVLAWCDQWTKPAPGR